MSPRGPRSKLFHPKRLCGGSKRGPGRSESMAYTLKNGRTPPVVTGRGVLTYRGFEGPVDYEVQGSFSSLRAGAGSLRGQFHADPAIAEAAFKACDGHLTLDTGKTYRVTMSGYSAGDARTYFDLRI